LQLLIDLPINHYDKGCPSKTKNKGNKKACSDGSIEMHLRQPNWKHTKITTSVKAKRDEQITTLDKVDPQDQFETCITKWKKTYMIVMTVGFFQDMRNGLTCKDRWGANSGEFKRIFLFQEQGKMKIIG